MGLNLLVVGDIEGLLPFKEATWTVGVTHSELKESNVKKVAVSDLDLPRVDNDERLFLPTKLQPPAGRCHHLIGMVRCTVVQLK